MSEGDRTLFFYGFQRWRSDSFSGSCFACLGHESCCCSRLSEAVLQSHVSRWVRSESSGRIDARTLLDRVFFMLSESDRTLFFYGFQRWRSESFSGSRLACLGHESCCCSRLSEAVFQGHVSRWVRRDSSGRIDERTFLDKSVFYDVGGLVFCMPWARILLLFEAFGSGFPRPCVEVSSERILQRTNWRAYLARQSVFYVVGGR